VSLIRSFWSVAGLAGALLMATSANAVTLVSIGISVDGGPIVDETLPATGPTASFGGIVGAGSYFVSALGYGVPLSNPNVLDSTSFNATFAGGVHTLNVYVTSQNNSGPVSNFISSFTSNTLSAATATETTYVDPGNGLFDGAQLNTASFTGTGSSVLTSPVGTAAVTYSVTELFSITSTGPGSANLTIDLGTGSTTNATTPIPATLPLLASALAGAWLWGRRRRKGASQTFDQVA